MTIIMNFSAISYFVYIGLLGITTAHLFPLPLSKAAKTFIGPALGIIIVTLITLVVSLLVSFHRGSIVASTTIYSVGIIVAFLIKRPTLTPSRFTLKQLLIRLKSVWPFILVFFIVGSLVVYIFWTKVLAPTDYGLVTGGGGLYGDTALHSAYTMSIVEQGLPPVNPLYAGIPLVYPFLVNLFSAILVMLGSSLRFAFILPQLMYFLGFVTLFYLVAKRVAGNRGAFFALLIFFLGWGLGFTEYLSDVSQTGKLMPTKEYTNNLPGFHMHNVLTGLIFPERSFLPGLFIGMLITILVIQQLNNSAMKQWNNVIIGVLLGILPLWHTHTFLFFVVAVGIWYAVKTPREWADALSRGGGLRYLFNKHLSPLLLTYASAFLLALPAFLWFRQQVSHDNFIRFTLGWIDSASNPLLFWFKNTGVLIPLALLGVVLIKRNLKSFFIPAILMFFIANLVTFQPWDWDNIKLFSWVFLFASIAAGYGLAPLVPSLRLREERGELRIIYRGIVLLIRGITVFLLLLFLTASGILSLIHLTSQEFGIYSHDDIQLAEWVKAYTPKEAVFLIDPWPNHPVPGLTGRSVYLGYPGHLWVHGIKYGEREALVKKIIGGDTTTLKNTEVPIDYIVTDQSRKGLLNALPLVYENQKLAIYKVN